MSPVSGVDGDVVDDGIINAFSQPPLGMADDRLCLWPPLSLSHALSVLDPFPAFEVRGELLIFFVFTLTFEAKRRKLIEGLISTQPATHSHTHSKTHTNKGKLTAKRDCVNMAYD